jgi:hypothetical protein
MDRIPLYSIGSDDSITKLSGNALYNLVDVLLTEAVIAGRHDPVDMFSVHSVAHLHQFSFSVHAFMIVGTETDDNTGS